MIRLCVVAIILLLIVAAQAAEPVEPRFTCAQVIWAYQNYSALRLEVLAILFGMTKEERAFARRCVRKDK